VVRIFEGKKNKTMNTLDAEMIFVEKNILFGFNDCCKVGRIKLSWTFAGQFGMKKMMIG
jgi:hypothetical protein